VRLGDGLLLREALLDGLLGGGRLLRCLGAGGLVDFRRRDRFLWLADLLDALRPLFLGTRGGGYLLLGGGGGSSLLRRAAGRLRGRLFSHLLHLGGCCCCRLLDCCCRLLGGSLLLGLRHLLRRLLLLLGLLAQAEAAGGSTGALRLLQAGVLDAGAKGNLQVPVDDALLLAHHALEVLHDVLEDGLPGRAASLLHTRQRLLDHLAVLGVLTAGGRLLLDGLLGRLLRRSCRPRGCYTAATTAVVGHYLDTPSVVVIKTSEPRRKVTFII